MASVFDYIFNIGGNYTATINGMSTATGDFSAKVSGAQNRIGKLTTMLASIDLVKNSIDGIKQATDAFSGSGIALDKNMHDLSAVAGVTGDSLKQIEGFARQSAKTFGTDASVAVEGYKLLLSQLSPELGKYPEALSAMGDCIQTTSKLMGGDGVAAAQVLTTAMNQYGVSLEDPIAASKEMARMMNVMAAAGQAGSAELPAQSAALQQCGMASKAANVSFEETAAAIQVLDKAGKKASEGGVALRNVLGQLSKGRFVEKQAAEELQKAGIDVVALGDNSKTLKERLEMLKPMLNDSALLSKFFGVENANAARALIQGTEALDGFTQAVTGTNSATDQAAIKGCFEEKRAAEELQKTVVVRDLLSNLKQQSSSIDLSKMTEYTLYNISKNFYETFNYINRNDESSSFSQTNNLKNRISYIVSFSNYAIPTVKPVKQESNYNRFVTENLSCNMGNYFEALNSLAKPSYSTTLTFCNPNFYSENKIINILNINDNFCQQDLCNLDLCSEIGLKPNMYTTRESTLQREEVNYENPFDVFNNERIEKKQNVLTKEDVEFIVNEMFRREVELCSY